MNLKTSTLEPLRFSYDCIPCAVGSLNNLFKNGLVPEDKQEDAMRGLLKYLSDVNFQQSPPVMGQAMHRIIRKLLNKTDPYKEIKQKFNTLMLEYYPRLRKKVESAPNPFDMAMRLAIAGNIIDFGPRSTFDVDATLKKVEMAQLAIDDSRKLQAACDNAKTLLYLGDNAGEIVMDRLFIETINHPNVYFAVRGAPIINDVTIEDAEQVGMNKIAIIITNGDDAPGTILENTSPQFQEIFNSADLIISKGQGNFESLTGNNQNIFYLLMAKCDHIAKHIGVKKGDFIVKG